MKKPLKQYITDALVLLSTIIFALLIIAFIIGIRKGVGIASDVNLSDAFSNALNIVALYVTVFFVINLTSKVTDSGKTVDLEKNIVIERIKQLHDKIEALHEIVDIGRLNFQDTIYTFNRLDRAHKAIVGFVNSADSTIGVEQLLIDTYSLEFENRLEECLNVLTFTPARNSPTLHNPSVTINQGQIIVTANGKQLATIHFEGLKATLNSFLLTINRT
jgi:hypothetical protein